MNIYYTNDEMTKFIHNFYQYTVAIAYPPNVHAPDAYDWLVEKYGEQAIKAYEFSTTKYSHNKKYLWSGWWTGNTFIFYFNDSKIAAEFKLIWG